MQPVKAMKHAAEFILSMHELIVAEGRDSDSSPMLEPFFSFVCQCLTYFSELIDALAGSYSLYMHLNVGVFELTLCVPSCRGHELAMQSFSYNRDSACFIVRLVICKGSSPSNVHRCFQHPIAGLERLQFVRCISVTVVLFQFFPRSRV